jgi:iron complex transport system ATP-binding protein
VTDHIISNSPLYGRGISFSYHDRLCLHGIDLDVRRGELLGILGPNGSGKSTLLKTILGYLSPQGGEIALMGDQLGKLRRSERARRLSFVPQNSGLRVPLTVFQAVLLGRYARMGKKFGGYSFQDKDAVNKTLLSLELSHLAERPVTELSGGEFQKVLLARALVQNTPVLLLDEATSNLDVHHTLEIMNLVRQKVEKEKRAVIAVMHDLNLASSSCDRILIMKEGSVYSCGLPAEVITEKMIHAVYGVPLKVLHDEEGLPFVLPRLAGVKEAVCAS